MIYPRSAKLYECNNPECKHKRMVTTNHYGMIYDRCPKCAWKRPMDVCSHKCLETPPPPDLVDRCEFIVL